MYANVCVYVQREKKCVYACENQCRKMVSKMKKNK